MPEGASIPRMSLGVRLVPNALVDRRLRRWVPHRYGTILMNTMVALELLGALVELGAFLVSPRLSSWSLVFFRIVRFLFLFVFSS